MGQLFAGLPALDAGAAVARRLAEMGPGWDDWRTMAEPAIDVERTAHEPRMDRRCVHAASVLINR